MDGALVDDGCWLTVAQKYHSPNRVQAWNVFNCKSISSSAQYVTLQKYVFTYKFSYVLFCNPTHKTEIGTANRWGTTNSKPPGRIIMMGQIRNSEQRLNHIYYTLFCKCIALLRFLSAMVKRFSPAVAMHAMMLSQNHFPEPNQYTLGFLPPILLCKIERPWRCSKYSDAFSFT